MLLHRNHPECHSEEEEEAAEQEEAEEEDLTYKVLETSVQGNVWL